MKPEYRNFKYLSSQSGFGWNASTKTIDAADEVWATLDVAYQKYKGKSFQFFEEFDLLFGLVLIYLPINFRSYL